MFHRKHCYLRLSESSNSAAPSEGATQTLRATESGRNDGSQRQRTFPQVESQLASPPKILPTQAALHSSRSEEEAELRADETGFETYEAFYGMREPPFALTPNPAFFFVNERSREGVKQIEYGIRRREGFAVISGEVGTGKTTLCWALLEKLEKMNVCTALVLNPMVSATDVLKLILLDLGVRPKGRDGEPIDPSHLFDTSWMAGMGQVELVERLNTFLIQMARKGLFTVVIIDEAQRLSIETLEQLRLLSNLETANQKLLQIIFVGQAELERTLKKPELRQLNQRISVRLATQPLSRKDTGAYIRHRLRVAWAIPRLRFKKRAFKVVHRLSRGYPRVINMICDRALYYAFQRESYIVTPKMVRRSFKSIKKLDRSRGPIWIRRLILLAAGLILTLLGLILFLMWKNVIPAKASVSSPTFASGNSAVSASRLDRDRMGRLA
jgi:general secretion pathway protein A